MINIDLLLIEAIVVGIYTTILYAVLDLSLPPIIPPIFVYLYLGFYKHFLAYFIGIHNYYCNNGNACMHTRGTVKQAVGKYILLDSLLEGVIFAIVCGIGMTKRLNPYLNIFIIAISIHLFAEISGIHGIFCKYRCVY